MSGGSPGKGVVLFDLPCPTRRLINDRLRSSLVKRIKSKFVVPVEKVGHAGEVQARSPCTVVLPCPTKKLKLVKCTWHCGKVRHGIFESLGCWKTPKLTPDGWLELRTLRNGLEGSQEHCGHIHTCIYTAHIIYVYIYIDIHGHIIWINIWHWYIYVYIYVYIYI